MNFFAVKKFAFTTLALALFSLSAPSHLASGGRQRKGVTGQGKTAGTKSKDQPAHKGRVQKSESSPQVTEAIKKLKADFDNELALRTADIKRLSESLQKKQELFSQGIIAKKDVAEAAANLQVAQVELAARQQKIDSEIQQANDLVAEAVAAEQLAKTPLRGRTYIATNALIRYNGSANWIISDITKVSSFFVATFNHALPISAFGQTEVHNRLGFDHRNAVDVALHPDSAEGQALITYLRNAGIPFIAFRQAVPGSATGAHIHIGYPSHRFIQR